MAHIEGRSLPGPWGLPIIGSMLTLDKNATHLSFIKLAKTYGNIYKLRLGSLPVVVLNGFKAIKMALEDQPDVFEGRPDPQMYTFQLMNELTIYGPSLAFETSSDRWKFHRNIIDLSIWKFTRGNHIQFLESVASGEAEELVRHLKVPQSEGGLEVKRLLHLSSANLILWYMLSRRSSYDDKLLDDILRLQEQFEKPSGGGDPIDFLPWLRYFTSKSTDRLTEFRTKMGKLLGEIIEEHDVKYRPESERDVMDTIISTGRKSGKDFKRLKLDGMALYQSVFDLFAGGFDTVAATLQWIMMYMVVHPRVQIDVQREIDNTVGRDRLPTLKDRSNLPLTQSCLLEIQRHASVVPFAVPHSTTKDTVLGGFFIPKDIVVFINLYAAHYDPDIWQKPEVFDPRRFLNEDGSLDKEKAKYVIPNGIGVRHCPGIDLVSNVLFMYFTTFLQQLTFRCPNDQECSLEAINGFPRWPKDFNVKISPRSET